MFPEKAKRVPGASSAQLLAKRGRSAAREAKSRCLFAECDALVT